MPARRIKIRKNNFKGASFSIKEIVHSGTQSILNGSLLRDRIKLEHLREKQHFLVKHPHAVSFLNKKGLDLSDIRKHSARVIASGALAGALFLSAPAHAQAPSLPPPMLDKLLDSGIVIPDNPQKYLVFELARLLPPKTNPLPNELEKIIGLLFERLTGIKARGTLEGEHLNTTYGYIGTEQHLPRFPGDTIGQHDEFRESGITPGRGAWGYFAYSKAQMTQDLIEKEKWYVAVQTLYLPDWEERLKYLRDWYKYRKVVVIDVDSGNAVVAVITDAGPAAWTGKHFGGSPEVMNSLGGPRYKKGKVLLLFVDDPENKIPLGPVDYMSLKLEKPVVAME